MVDTDSGIVDAERHGYYWLLMVTGNLTGGWNQMWPHPRKGAMWSLLGFRTVREDLARPFPRNIVHAVDTGRGLLGTALKSRWVLPKHFKEKGYSIIFRG